LHDSSLAEKKIHQPQNHYTILFGWCINARLVQSAERKIALKNAFQNILERKKAQ
jgi:hypothetical protein